MAYHSIYQQLITDATRETDPARIHAIEALMRCEYATLDHLDRATFRRLARACAKELTAALADGWRLDPTFGIVPPDAPTMRDCR